MNEQELRQAMSALEMFRAQLESISGNQQLIQMSLEELARAKETLSKYQSTPQGSDILVPIGGNSFVFATVASNNKALIGIGSGITIEKPIEEAAKMMEDRARELSETAKKLNDRRITLEEQAGQLSDAIQSEMQAAQQRG